MGDKRSTSATFSAVAVGKLVEFAFSRGFDGLQLARIAEVDLDALRDPERQVKIDRLYASWEILMEWIDEPGLPIAVARSYRVEDLHVMGFATMTSSTAREAVNRAVRYFALFSNSGRWRVEEEGDGVEIRWWRNGELTLGHRLANEAALATFLHIFRQVIDENLTASVSFRHVAPSDISAHREFFHDRVKFGAAHDALVVSRALLERVPRKANPQLSAFFDSHAKSLLPDYTRDDLTDQVRQSISRELMSGRLTAATVAHELGLSERSMRRRLAEADLSFRDLVNEVRRTRAQELLRNPEASMTDIAFLLGFSESSAFTRACKRWFGCSPKDIRGKRPKEGRD